MKNDRSDEIWGPGLSGGLPRTGMNSSAGATLKPWSYFARLSERVSSSYSSEVEKPWDWLGKGRLGFYAVSAIHPWYRSGLKQQGIQWLKIQGNLHWMESRGHREVPVLFRGQGLLWAHGQKVYCLGNQDNTITHFGDFTAVLYQMRYLHFTLMKYKGNLGTHINQPYNLHTYI